MVQRPMNPVIPVILYQEIHQQLRSDLPQWRQRQPRPDPHQLLTKPSIKTKMTPNSNADREKVLYLDGRVGEDLKRADGEDEDADDGQVAAEKGGGGEMDLGLELEARD